MNSKSILIIGTNQKIAPNFLSRKMIPVNSSLDEWTKSIYAKLTPSLFSEKIILSTCHRVEIYVITAELAKATKELEKILASVKTYSYKDQEAATHLFEVASGIDSVVIGELEILAQVKNAYQSALKVKVVGPILHQLFKDAIHIGKEARAKTTISAGSPSIANAIHTLLQKEKGKNIKQKALIIGAGDIAQQVVKNLVHTTNITIANRTYAKAQQLAKKFVVQAIPFNKLENHLNDFDIIVSATTLSRIIISSIQVKAVMKNRKRDLYLIDLAVPRNIDPKTAKIKQVYLYQLEDVQKLINKNQAIRQKGVSKVRELIDRDVEKFWKWYLARKIGPVLQAVNKKAFSIQNAELKKAFKKLNHLSRRDKEVISALSSGIVNKLLAVPIENLKLISYEKREENYISAIKELFELDLE